MERKYLSRFILVLDFLQLYKEYNTTVAQRLFQIDSSII